MLFVDRIVFGMHKLLEIVLIKVENDLEILIGRFVDDFPQGNDIGMIFEIFKSGNLPECSGGYAFVFVFELNVLDGNNRIGELVLCLVDFSKSALSNDGDDFVVFG